MNDDKKVIILHNLFGFTHGGMDGDIADKYQLSPRLRVGGGNGCCYIIDYIPIDCE